MAQKLSVVGTVVAILAFFVVIPDALADNTWFPPNHFVYAETIMAQADSNGDGILSVKEGIEYLELYGLLDIPLAALDLNEDGNLTVHEINSGITNKELTHADSNHDGLVSLNEGRKFIGQHGVQTTKSALKKYDTDRNGYLSVDEVNQIPQKLFASPMDSLLQAKLQEGLKVTTNADIWKYADLNHDGKVSLVELATALTDHGNYQINAFDIMRIDVDHDAYISVDEFDEFRD